DPYMLEQSLTDIEFHPFLIKIDKYNIYITALGCPSTGNADEVEAGVGYIAMFTEIYQNGVSKYHYTGMTPNEVCSSTIIEFHNSIALLYPQQYIFKDRELRAWRALFKAAGCHEITLFTNNKSKECFKNVYNANKKGQDGRTRILSIIAKEFTYAELEKKLGV
ncbi:25088_t:CDS:2, partial [Racocetra persica]